MGFRVDIDDLREVIMIWLVMLDRFFDWGCIRNNGVYCSTVKFERNWFGTDNVGMYIV